MADSSPQNESPLVSTLQASLGRSYTIDRELGGGGMSRVFVATDASLDRRVVVKVLSPELAQGLSVDRFAREIRLAAALQDTHIVPVLSAGTTTDGLPYYTMPFVEGQSLRARMGAGPLPMDEALRVLRDVAEALEYAHGHGVVHRDIKPENVLLSGRAAVVADFGIAKALSAARTGAPGGTLTQVGQSLGTPAYMAPEQATGDETDHRADIYSWGLVAYELLAGVHPFANKPSVQQLIAAQVTETPRHLNEVKPSLPPPLGALVMRCLEKIPGARPQSATELLAELSAISSGATSTSNAKLLASKPRSRTWSIAAAVVLLVAIAAGALYYTRSGSVAEGPPSLAVLPFEHQGEAGDAYLTDGITDAIRGKLTGLQNVVVIARGSSNSYRGSKKSLKEIAQELGVRYLLTGTVQVVGSGDARRVMVRPELVEITKDAQPQSRWQQPVDATVNDVLKVQGTIAEQVVGKMEVALGKTDRQKLVVLPTADPAAYDAYLRGMAETKYGASNDVEALMAALPFFKQAVARDPKLVDGWTEIARTTTLLYVNGTPNPEWLKLAQQALDRLEALDPAGASVHRVRGFFLRLVREDFVGAVAELKQARDLAPNDAFIRVNLAMTELDAGSLDEALRETDASIRLDPRAASAYIARSRALAKQFKFEEARAAIRRGRIIAPSSLALASYLPQVSLAEGDLARARRDLDEISQTIPRDRLVRYVATYEDNGWILNAEDEKRLLALGVEGWAGDLTARNVTLANQAWWGGDLVKARQWADSALRTLRAELAAAPSDLQRRELYANMLALHGDHAAARDSLTQIMPAMDLPSRRYSLAAMYDMYVSARIAVVLGDRDLAFARLKKVIESNGSTPARLRLDPSFKSLRDDPRFEEALRR